MNAGSPHGPGIADFVDELGNHDGKDHSALVMIPNAIMPKAGSSASRKTMFL